MATVTGCVFSGLLGVFSRTVGRSDCRLGLTAGPRTRSQVSLRLRSAAGTVPVTRTVRHPGPGRGTLAPQAPLPVLSSPLLSSPLLSESFSASSPTAPQALFSSLSGSLDQGDHKARLSESGSSPPSHLKALRAHWHTTEVTGQCPCPQALRLSRVRVFAQKKTRRIKITAE
eukprot:793519-Rhodomonas_salina.3